MVAKLGLFFSGIPVGLLLLFSSMTGGIFGLGAYTFSYAQGFSYFSDDPRACANCHVMREVYDAWNRGSHKHVATCNDCHTPHALATKYAVKALNGWNHSSAFTMGNFPEPIRITAFNREIAKENCLACHADLVDAISHLDSSTPTDCLACHNGAGHALTK